MPLPRWLRARPPAPPQVAPPPAPLPPASPPPAPIDDAPDPHARIHIAAHDPDFPRKREAAVTAILVAIDAVAGAAGYTRTGTTWARQSPRGRTAVNLQRSQYGFEAYINLRFLPADGIDLDGTLWAQDDDIRIARFYPADDSRGPDAGVIYYLDIHDNPASLDEPMRILRTRALPWLDAHHQGLPGIADYPIADDMGE